jgi:hypothetical protein
MKTKKKRTHQSSFLIPQWNLYNFFFFAEAKSNHLHFSLTTNYQNVNEYFFFNTQKNKNLSPLITYQMYAKKKLLKKYTQTYDIVVSEKKNWIIWRGAHRRETYKIYNEKKKKAYTRWSLSASKSQINIFY